MKKLTSTISSLKRIGLTEPALKLQVIQQLYRQAAADFSTEIDILEKLSEIAAFFDGKSLEARAPSGMKLPAYSLETADKYIVYAGDDLTDFSKKEILTIGIPNFLKSFLQHYMDSREGTLSGYDRRRYVAAIDELKDLQRNVKEIYKKISKEPRYAPKHKFHREISKNTMAKQLRAIELAFGRMADFQSQVEENYVPLLAAYYGGIYRDNELVPPSNEEEEFLIRQMQDESKAIQEAVRKRKEKEPRTEIERIDHEKYTQQKEEEEDEFQEEEIPEDFLEDEEDLVEEEEQSTADPATQALLEKIKQRHKEQEELEKSSAYNLLKLITATKDPLDYLTPEKQHNIQEDTLRRLSNLTYDFQEIRDEFDEDGAARLGMTVEEFRARLKVDALLEFSVADESQAKTAATIPGPLERVKKNIEKRQKPRRMKQRQRALKEQAREAAWKIMKGVVHNKHGELFDPSIVEMGWERLQMGLRVAYKSFIRELVRKYKGWQQQEDLTPEQEEAHRQQFLEENRLEKKHLVEEVDDRLGHELQNIIRILRG